MTTTTIKEQGEDHYCGFLCSEILEQQQRILDEIRDFSEYNPEFAREMINRIINLCRKEAKID